ARRAARSPGRRGSAPRSIAGDGLRPSRATTGRRAQRERSRRSRESSAPPHAVVPLAAGRPAVQSVQSPGSSVTTPTVVGPAFGAAGGFLRLDRLPLRTDDVPRGAELVDVLALLLIRGARVGGVVVERVAPVGHMRVAVVPLDRAERRGRNPAHALLCRVRIELRPNRSTDNAAVALAL